MKKGYLISTGTELLLGSTIDTNSMFIAEKLSDSGIKVIGKSIVGDNREQIEAAFELGIRSADIVISSGGMGPTQDDLTKQVACEFMGCRLEIVPEEVEHLKDYFASRKRSMPEINLKQAMFPPEAIILKNALGTAPGMYLNKDGKIIVLLPGPPREMKDMFLKEVEPLLTKELNLNGNQAARKTIKVLGPGESQVEELLGGLMKDSRGSLALLAMDGEIHVKVTAEGKDRNESQQMLESLVQDIAERLGNHIVGYDEQSLASVVADLMVDRGKRAAFAESCTGGLLSKMITDLPGSTAYFWGAVTSYSNEAKKLFLDVNEDTLTNYGAVSSETAVMMAQGIRIKSGTDLGLAVTGIAGPDGGSEEKPVGLVFIALADESSCQVKEMRFVGSREGIRILAAKSALDLLRRKLLTVL